MKPSLDTCMYCNCCFHICMEVLNQIKATEPTYWTQTLKIKFSYYINFDTPTLFWDMMSWQCVWKELTLNRKNTRLESVSNWAWYTLWAVLPILKVPLTLWPQKVTSIQFLLTIITSESHIKVTKTKKIIANSRSSWFLIKFPLLQNMDYFSFTEWVLSNHLRVGLWSVVTII